MMGRYFNPATKAAIIAAGGLEIEPGRSHAAMLADVPEGFCLAYFLDRIIFKQVADVTPGREYQEFQRQVDNGDAIFLGAYALPSDKFTSS